MPTGERCTRPEPMPFICQSLKIRTDMCPPKAGPRWSEKSKSHRRTAPDTAGAARTFQITHPFHPFSGQCFELVSNRWHWGQEWIFFYDDKGQLRSVAVDWTSLCLPDPFVILSNGRAKFRPGDLFRLAELIDKIGGSGQEQSSGKLLRRGWWYVNVIVPLYVNLYMSYAVLWDSTLGIDT